MQTYCGKNVVKVSEVKEISLTTYCITERDKTLATTIAVRWQEVHSISFRIVLVFGKIRLK